MKTKAMIEAPKMARRAPTSLPPKTRSSDVPPLDMRVATPRVEDVAGSVGDDARRGHRRQDADPREDRYPPLPGQGVVQATRDHRPPLRRRNLDAEPDEAERGEAQDRVAEDRSPLHQERRHRVRRDVSQHDAAGRGADRRSGLDEEERAEAEHVTPEQP